MSMAISFLSGKGGSGKTTMVLGLADLFSKSKISTLLVDCDFVTNGATYFFEPIISSIANKEKNSILSFYDVLFSSQELKPSCIKVKPFWDMIPSIPEISVLQSNNYMSISYDDYCCKMAHFPLQEPAFAISSSLSVSSFEASCPFLVKIFMPL